MVRIEINNLIAILKSMLLTCWKIPPIRILADFQNFESFGFAVADFQI